MSGEVDYTPPPEVLLYTDQPYVKHFNHQSVLLRNMKFKSYALSFKKVKFFRNNEYIILYVPMDHSLRIVICSPAAAVLLKLGITLIGTFYYLFFFTSPQ